MVEKETYEAREKTKSAIVKMLNGERESSETEEEGFMPGIVYDEFGKPRPARMAYDGARSDDPPQPARRRQPPVRPLPPETVPLDDDNPFPNLSPPLG